MRWLLIKQVPDTEPDADGVWICRQITNRFFWLHSVRAKWRRLERVCDPGFHPVQYGTCSQEHRKAY